MDWTVCPQCGAVAEVQWRAVLDSTDGPVEHAKVVCLHRHWFLLPTAGLTSGTGQARRGGSHPAGQRPVR